MRSNQYRFFGLILLLTMGLSGCSVFSGGKFVKCPFVLTEWEKVELCSVDVTSATSLKTLNAAETSELVKGFAKADLPIVVTALMNVRNPNKKEVWLKSYDWELLFDGNRVAKGSEEPNLLIDPNNGTVELRLTGGFNLMEKVTAQGKNAILSAGLGLVEEGNSDRLLFRVKPTLLIGKKLVYTYPDFVKL